MKLTRLKALRESKGMSQKDLGEILNVGQKSISRYENGEADPDLDMLCVLSKFFHVSIDYLLDNNIEEQTVSEAKASIRNLDRNELITLMEKQIDLLTLVEKNKKSGD